MRLNAVRKATLIRKQRLHLINCGSIVMYRLGPSTVDARETPARNQECNMDSEEKAK